MLVSKRDRPIWKLQIGDVKTKPVQKFNYLGILSTDDGKCNTGIWKHIRIAKDVFYNLNKMLSNRKMLLGTKIRRQTII